MEYDIHDGQSIDVQIVSLKEDVILLQEFANTINDCKTLEEVHEEKRKYNHKKWLLNVDRADQVHQDPGIF